jgi:hypothetical protein
MRVLQRSFLASRVCWAAALFTCCATLVGASPAFAQLTLNVTRPQAGSTIGDTLSIVAVANPFAPTPTITATVDGRSTPLYLDIFQGWVGSISLKGLASGEHTLLVEASNTLGQTAQKQVTFIYDPSPVLTLTEPLQFAIGEQDIAIKGTCADDKGMCTVRVDAMSSPSPLVSTTLLVLKGSTFDTAVTPGAGEQILTFTPMDGTSPGLAIRRTIFVSRKGGLPVEATFQGTLLDIDASRALTFDNTVSPSVVRLYDRVGNTNQIIWTAAPASGSEVFVAYLTPGNGALILVETPMTYPYQLFEWRGGALTEVGLVDSRRQLRVKGAWAVFSGFDSPCCATSGKFLRDLDAGTNIQFSASHDGAFADVTPNGRAVFNLESPAPPEVFQFDSQPPPGATTTLTSSDPQHSFAPLSDGINVVFLRTPNVVDPTYSIVLRTAAGVEEMLATELTSLPIPEFDYQIAGGWTAFMRNGSGDSRRVLWIREPDGTLRQVSSGGNARIEALSETGDLVFTTPATIDGWAGETRYLASADGTIRELGPRPFGTVRFIGGAPYLMVENQLVAVGPASPSRSILSEGATGTFFSTDVALLNPAATPVDVAVRYFREGQPEIVEDRTLAARSRTTIHLGGVAGLEGTAVSTQVDAPNGETIVAERLMSWDATGYGGHLGSAVDAPRRKWLFAEGAQGYFSTFFLLANGGATEATVRFTFLVELGEPVEHTVTVPPASRRTFYAGELAALVNRSFATTIEADVPIVAERAMYFGDSPLWLGGHGSAGVPAPALRWYHAEGATGSLFDTFILLANPNAEPTGVNVSYFTDTGVSVHKMKELPAFGRLTINIEDEAPELASANVATLVTSTSSSSAPAGLPIVSERAMYWGTTGTGWREAHNSFGVTESGLKWGLAEGRAGGDRGYQTYVLISNSHSDAADVKLTFIREDGVTVEKTRTASAGQRLNVNASDLPELANSNFATIVESTNGVTINVESAIYWNAGGVIWEAGGNTVATPIP